jgi:hypothetical protein
LEGLEPWYTTGNQNADGEGEPTSLHPTAFGPYSPEYAAGQGLSGQPTINMADFSFHDPEMVELKEQWAEGQQHIEFIRNTTNSPFYKMGDEEYDAKVAREYLEPMPTDTRGSVKAALDLAGIGFAPAAPQAWATKISIVNELEAAGQTTVLRPVGLGSTGRTVANNLTEQLAMKEVLSNPLKGGPIAKMAPLSDPRWLGWFKMQFIHTAPDGTKTVIHYVGKMKNGILEAVDDFKFIDKK